MKIQSIKQYGYSSVQNTAGKPAHTTRTSIPTNFKGGDSFGFCDVSDKLPDIDTSYIPENISLSTNSFKGYDELVGEVDSQPFVMNYEKDNKYSGKHQGKEYSFKMNSSFFGTIKGYTGILDGKNINIKYTSIDDNNFMIGTIGNKPIKLMGEDSWAYSRIKGYIGNEKLDLIIKYSEDKKQIEGTINDNKFAFIDKYAKTKGGIESDSKLFPIILALADLKKNPQDVFPKMEDTDPGSDTRLGG